MGSDFLMSSHTYAADLGRGHERGFALARSLELSVVKKKNPHNRSLQRRGEQKRKEKAVLTNVGL